jgi:hypothetical protein
LKSNKNSFPKLPSSNEKEQIRLLRSTSFNACKFWDC